MNEEDETHKIPLDKFKFNIHGCMQPIGYGNMVIFRRRRKSRLEIAKGCNVILVRCLLVTSPPWLNMEIHVYMNGKLL